MNSDLTSIVSALDRLTATQRKGPWDYASTIAVVLTLLVLVWYTIETMCLRRAAQAQTERSSELLTEAQRQNETSLRLVTEAQAQNEIALRPILVLLFETVLSHDSGRVLPGSRSLEIKNLGNGPAFNVTIDHLRLDEEDAKYWFFYPDTLGKGECKPVYCGDFHKNGETMATWETIEEAILRQGAVPLPQMLTVNYRSAGGHLYYTKRRLDRTADLTLNLEFDRCGILDLSTVNEEGV